MLGVPAAQGSGVCSYRVAVDSAVHRGGRKSPGADAAPAVDARSGAAGRAGVLRGAALWQGRRDRSPICSSVRAASEILATAQWHWRGSTKGMTRSVR